MTTAGGKAERIAWLAEFSAARRLARNNPPRRVFVPVEQQDFFEPVVTVVGGSKRKKGPAQKKPGLFSDAPRMTYLEQQRQLSLLIPAQDGLCYLCSCKFGAGVDKPTFDHVTPFSVCGVNEGNGLAACWKCNNKKADRLPTQEELDFLERVNFKIKQSVSVTRTRSKRRVENGR